MFDAVLDTISRYRMLQPHHRVAVAVSGGPDSVCLLHVLRELAPRLPLRLSVAHFNHNLRAESGSEAEFVEKLAAEAGLPFYLGSAEPGELANAEESNLPQAARQARYRFLHGLQQQNQVDRIAVAHTLDDQAETVLLRLLRGSGTTGLAAIHPVTPGHVVRPLLDIRRQQVISFLEERSLPWLNDPTNANLDYARARMRHMLLPQLREQWNSQLDAALGHTASLAYEEELYWQQQAEQWMPQLGEWQGTVAPAFVTDVRRWQDLPPALRRRVLRQVLEQAREGQTALRPLDFAHVDGALRLLTGEEPQARLQLPGLDVWRSYTWLRVAPLTVAAVKERFWEFALAPPCRVALPDSASWLQFTHVQRDGYSAEQPAWAYNVGGCSLDTDLLQQPLQARSWRPGDALARSGNKLLKTLFQDARIPLWERRSWPVLTAGGTIVWTRRFGVADGFAASPQARIVLRVWETSESKSYVGTSV